MGAGHFWSPGAVGEVVQRARFFGGSGVASVPQMAGDRPGERVRPVFFVGPATASLALWHTNAQRWGLVFMRPALGTPQHMRPPFEHSLAQGAHMCFPLSPALTNPL